MDRTTDYLNRDGTRVADLFAQEAEHMFRQWAHLECTHDDLKELSVIAANLGDRFKNIAGDALDMAEQLNPTPIGFTAEDIDRIRLHLVKAEEYAADTDEFEVDAP